MLDVPCAVILQFLSYDYIIWSYSGILYFGYLRSYGRLYLIMMYILLAFHKDEYALWEFHVASFVLVYSFM